MRILLVEDDEFKQRDILECIQDVQNKTNINIKTFCVKTFVDAQRKIISEDFDLAIFDITIPLKANNYRQEALGGIELLIKMLHFNKTYPVTLVTQFDSFNMKEGLVTLAKIKSDIQQLYHMIDTDLISYNMHENKWRTELFLRIEKTIHEKAQ